MCANLMINYLIRRANLSQFKPICANEDVFYYNG